ncbi:MAG: hypothetical protein KC549_12255, partial [Myxococcales bacterium]|nr:hypothetical protein [Myxococcales bacterium]
MRLLLPAALALLAACDDDPVRQDPSPDVQVQDEGPRADVGPDEGVPPDEGVVADAAVDAHVPPPILDAPLAWVYANDPTTDEGELTQVALDRVTDPEGRLTSPSVQVFNCLNEEGGLTAMPDLGGFTIEVSLCHEVQTVRPDADGNYLSVRPPEDGSDPNDPFAEVMMYHHVNHVHDYFKGTHGFDDLDFPLPAIVNLQFKINPPLPLPGFMPGPDGWYAFPNAAFFPKESWNELAASFGLPGRDSDSIIFGQAGHDFAYDARVIYHEYTHAVVGTSRLQVPAAVDRYGLDGSSRAMNEGLADYFAGTLADGPAIGVFGIGELAPDQVRDMTDARRCPDDLFDEVHADGRIIGSTLWAVRQAIGAEITDRIVFRALEQFTEGTTHQIAAELILAEAEEEGAEIHGQVLEIFGNFGFIDCERSIPWARFRVEGSRDGLPHRVEGRNTVGIPGFGRGVPAYKQQHVDVPAGTLGVTLSWQPQAGSAGFIPGAGGAPQALDLLIRRGETIEVQPGREAAYVADERFTAELTGATQHLTLDASCLPADGGRLYTLFINPGNDPVNLLA